MLNTVTQRAKLLQKARDAALKAEYSLRDALNEIGHGEANLLAKQIGFSAAFVSDIRHGRRAISDRFLQHLCGE